jgi:hypothetical protein
MRIFNTAGPVNPEDHYRLPPLERFDLFEIELLIAQKKYFVLHAPRQTGKTTSLLALQDYLNQQGKYHCLYFNVEPAQSAREEVSQGMQAILSQIGSAAKRELSDSYVESIWRTVLAQDGAHTALNHVLASWAENSAKPLVLLIDEIDSLVGDTLIAVLRQLRAGYTNRPDHFPASVILCGVRDVKDYRLRSSSGQPLIIGTGSLFNIKGAVLRMDNFTQNEVESLYAQHSAETGQAFEPQALALVWELTRGQPWLVNALGDEVCFKMKNGQKRRTTRALRRKKPISAEMVSQAKEQLMQCYDHSTHLGHLADKLKEARVQRVISNMVLKPTFDPTITLDDIEYVQDLGLAHRGDRLQITSPIYGELITKELGSVSMI